MSETTKKTVHCSCGSVEVEAVGSPIVSVVCYCDDCRAGSLRLEALPGATTVQTPDGGTGYVSYREDRVKTTRGEDKLQEIKLKDDSATNRIVATCCNSAMFMRFDDSKHWLPIYRVRFGEDASPLEMRVQTKHRNSEEPLPDDVPSSKSWPPRFMWRLIKADIAMRLGR